MKRHNSSKLDINGVLLLDKPIGMSSNAALQVAKTLLKARKAGHSGSLDPLATGMLPLCFGEATKFSQYVLDADKCYRVTGQLGIKTSTADKEGEVIEKHEDFTISQETLEQVLANYRGEISQIPSMFSALKHNGVPLYKLARQGIEVERPARKVMIHSLALLSFDGVLFELEVTCSKGTYIRNLVEDIGNDLKVCAHVAELRRLYVNPYHQHKMINLDQLKALVEAEDQNSLQNVLPIESMLADYPIVELNETMAQFISNGQPIQSENQEHKGLLKLINSSGKLLGVGEVDDGRIIPRRLVNKRAIA